MVHDLKIKDCFADAIMAGDKTFELRKNDRGFQKGDTVYFAAVDGSGIFLTHPINEEVFTITYVMSGWGLEPGFVVFGMKREEG